MSLPSSSPSQSLVQVRRALVSVSDKSGLTELAAALTRHGIEMISTGGTAKALTDAGFSVRDVSEVTGSPEMLDGRVKTLHPAVHGGLLYVRGNAQHEATVREQAIGAIDLLVVNLYPFEATVRAKAPFADCVETIDIGGPAMIRSAAKNHSGVAVVVEPGGYMGLIAELDAHEGATTLAYRCKLAATAFARTAAYDGHIATWLAQEAGEEHPKTRVFSGRLLQPLRYGENPHQTAAFYATGEPRVGVATAQLLQGKQLSYNNVADTDAALELVAEFALGEAAVAIIKHANPCGVAVGATLLAAYQQALACDKRSAYGSIIACNRAIDAEAAAAIVELFTEVVVAPDATPEARAIFATKKNLRLLVTGTMPDPSSGGLMIRTLAGGFLVQSTDAMVLDERLLRVVTRRQPTGQEWADLRFAFTVAKHVKSNAIVYARGGATVGIGAGQMNRLDSARIAALKAKDAAQAQGQTTPATVGSVVASDAFFPFADGLMACVDAGATAIIQPGGALRDAEVIAAADAAGLAMVMTGIRHFRH